MLLKAIAAATRDITPDTPKGLRAVPLLEGDPAVELGVGAFSST